MPYCPKCGVELENNIKKCPLCKFDISFLYEENLLKEQKNYPQAENIYKKELLKMKNRIFYSLIMIVLSAIFSLFLFHFKYNIKIINYFIYSLISSLFYLYFFFGYTKFKYNLIGITLNTIFLTYFLDNGTWFFPYALPIILLTSFDMLFIIYLYYKNKSENKYIYIPVFILIFINILCVGLEIIIDINNKSKFSLSWSLVVFVSTLPIIIIILGLYHRLPEKFRISLKKKFHL